MAPRRPDETVRIRRERIAWAKAPAWARSSLERIAAVVADIRRDLAADAPHRWMPLVDIHPEGWVRGTSTVDGRSTLLERDGRHSFGVELPAQIVAYDGPLLRGLLIHEFSHCFESLERTMDHIAKAHTSGPIPKLALPPADDDASDDERHVDPADWFGPSVTSIPKRGDLRLYELSEPWLERWAEAGLPVIEAGQSGYRIDAHFTVDKAVARRAMELNRRRG